MNIFKGSINLFTLKGLHNYYKYLNNIVTEEKEIKIIIDYLVQNPISVKFNVKDKGFWCAQDNITLLTLILAIRDCYMHLYDKEEIIGGHKIGSLFIEGIKKEGNVFTLSIGS